MHAADITTCDNCGTVLQGEFCHACGQSAHNPLHDVKHALEEVFESFWHLDGRVFRTLRDLLVPGRVACNYLRGQRVRYIPPLRLFLVLIVLTFFVGRLTISDGEPAKPGTHNVHIVGAGQGRSTFDEATTEAEVQRHLDATLAGIAQAREQMRDAPFMAHAMDSAETDARAKAAARIAELRRNAGTPTPPADAVARDAERADAASTKHTDASAAADATPGDEAHEEDIHAAVDRFAHSIKGGRLRDPKAPWDARTNPVDVPWLPPLGDRWFNHRIANFAENVDRVQNNGNLIFELMLAAVPSALFMMIPLFALMLKLLYIGSGRSYLEHLVIALYSHAFLLLTLFASFALALSPLPAGLTIPLTVLLWGWAGVYLLVTQHRVYAQHWAVTLGKFVVVAFLYQFLIVMAAAYVGLAGLTSGH